MSGNGSSVLPAVLLRAQGVCRRCPTCPTWPHGPPCQRQWPGRALLLAKRISECKSASAQAEVSAARLFTSGSDLYQSTLGSIPECALPRHPHAGGICMLPARWRSPKPEAHPPAANPPFVLARPPALTNTWLRARQCVLERSNSSMNTANTLRLSLHLNTGIATCFTSSRPSLNSGAVDFMCLQSCSMNFTSQHNHINWASCIAKPTHCTLLRVWSSLHYSDTWHAVLAQAWLQAGVAKRGPASL